MRVGIENSKIGNLIPEFSIFLSSDMYNIEFRDRY